MGLFKHKKKWQGYESPEGLQDYFDEYFLELRSRGQLIFEQSVAEQAALFKQDLNKTVDRVNGELKEYLTKQLEQQFAELGKTAKEAQDAALSQLDQRVEALKSQHQQLGEDLKKSVDYQAAILNKAFDENTGRLNQMKDAQNAAIETLQSSVKALEEDQKKTREALNKSVADQQAVLIKVFEDHMAQIIEHYLLGALGDQLDLKAQLPGIIKQLQDNKQAIVDDMKL